jgi:uncharacterized protein (DUF169 family)
MEWKEYSKKLKEILEIKGSPIAVIYSVNPAESPRKEKCRACDALVLARDGKVVNLTKENTSCRGASWHLGLEPRPSGKEYRDVQKFLVEGEKFCSTITVFHRLETLGTPPPQGLAENVIIGPLEKSEMRPDLALFICNAEQACRLMTLATYFDGVPPKLEVLGATCHTAIAYSAVTGQINVSFIDFTSRRIQGFGKDELIITIPYEKTDNLIKAIPLCSAGTAKVEYPEEFRRIAGE